VKPETQLHLDRFFRTLERAPQSLLMLDYDGTLAPFRQERDQAFPYPGVAELLQQIIRGGHTRVVIVSGRDASETVPLLGITPAPEVWGLHGLQRRKPDGSIETVRLENDHLDALSDAYRWLDYQQLGHVAEIITGSIAVHWRGLDDCEAEQMRGRVLLGWKTLAESSSLELLDFDGGVEIRVAEADKGDVVRLLLDEEEQGTPAAYLGNDATDEHAFQAISGLGLAVLVRPLWRRTAAQLWLKPPDELLDFLTRWQQATRRRGARGGEVVTAVTG